MYEYRKLTPKQKAEALRYRQAMDYPLHRPPHWRESEGLFLISAATYEHKPYFRTGEDRSKLLDMIMTELKNTGIDCYGWVVIPTHYHLLVECKPLSLISGPLGRVHGRTSYLVNQRDGVRGRTVWCRFTDRKIRDERHYYATLNYIHYNPVKHEQVKKPLDWPCSSVHWYLEHFGLEWLRGLWQEYPPKDYGKGWDW